MTDRRPSHRRYSEGLRRRVIEGYGGACSCCNEKRWEFLCVEHYGHDRREHLGRVGDSRAIYRDLIKRGFPRGDYALLCYNCNNARAYSDHCPHEDEHEALLQEYEIYGLALDSAP